MGKKEAEASQTTPKSDFPSQEQLKQLKEMSLLSLSHTPVSEYEEIVKIIKNFFGVFFGINDEYTYSELAQRVSTAPIEEAVKQRIVQLIQDINTLLYSSEEVYVDGFSEIKRDFEGIIEELVPESHGQSKRVISTKPIVQTVPPQSQDEFLAGAAKIGSSLRSESEPPQINLLRKELGELEGMAKSFGSEIAKDFALIELESVKGDIALLEADPSSVKPEQISERLSRIRQRLSAG